MRLHAETRQGQFHLLLGQPLHNRIQPVQRELSLKLRQPVLLPRQQDQHRQFAAGVGQLQRLELLIMEQQHLALAVHRGHLCRLAAVHVEVGRLRRPLAEGDGPLALEVDRVHKHQARQLVEQSRRDEIADALPRRLFHPGVDLLPGPLGILHVVHRPNAGTQVRLDRL